MLLILLHAAATWFMTGLIWFVQVVHYPLAGHVHEASFVGYQQAHMAKTSLVVIPPMLAELAAAFALLIGPPEGVPEWAPWAGALLLAGIWASTALLQVPAHSALTAGLDLDQVRKLVGTNWVRTVLWTLRAVLAGAMIMWWVQANQTVARL